MKVVELPTVAEVAEQSEAAEAWLKVLGLDPDPELGNEIDWAAVIERAQWDLNKSGSGQWSGTIIVRDKYPLTRTVELGSHVTLQGDSRAMHHIGTSCGFYAVEGFAGTEVLKWKQPNPRARYSNFGGGIRSIHVEGLPGLTCVEFRAAQQSGGVDNLVCRGFGEGGTGLILHGDTYSVRDVFLDTVVGGEAQGTRENSKGVYSPERVQGLLIQNLTTHNCEVGARLRDPQQVAFLSMETELTERPLVVDYNANGLRVENLQVRHSEKILDIKRSRWPNDFLVELSGMVLDKGFGEVRIAGQEPFQTSGKTFRLAIQRRDRNTVKVIDVKKQRSSWNE